MDALSADNTLAAKSALEALMASPELHATRVFTFLRRPAVFAIQFAIQFAIPIVCHTHGSLPYVCHTPLKKFAIRMANLLYGKLLYGKPVWQTYFVLFCANQDDVILGGKHMMN